MLAELNALTPRGGPEKIDRLLVRGIIGLKHRLGMGVHWSSLLDDELHNRRGSTIKNAACLPNRSMTSGLLIWSTCDCDVFSKYGWIVPMKTKTGKEVATAFQELFINNAPPSRPADGQGYGILQPVCKESTNS